METETLSVADLLRQLDELRHEIAALRDQIETAHAAERRHESRPFVGPDRRKAA